MFFCDSNAHVQLNPIYFSLHKKYQEYLLGHPLSIFSPGRKAQSLIEASREKIAELLGAERKEQIIFTHGTSQAIEWGLELFNNTYLDKISYSQLEHFSVIDKIEKINQDNKFEIESLQKETFDFQIKNKNLIHLWAHNETGLFYNLNSYFGSNIFADAAQVIGKISFQLSNYPQIKVATFSPHKFGGPTGIGILYLQDLSWWKEFGTGSRYGLDITGTPDVFSILATAEILAQVQQEQKEKIQCMRAFQKTFESGMKNLGCQIIGEQFDRLPNTTFLLLPEEIANKQFQLIEAMEEKSIFPGLGSACGSIHNFENRTMTALEYPTESSRYLRFSTFGEYDSSDAEKIVNQLTDIFQKL